MASPATETLADLVLRRRQLLERLLLLCGKQGELVEAGATGPLLTLLGAKQKLIDELTDTERLLNPFREEDPAARQWASAEARAACADNAQRCTDLLAAIRELEARHGKRMAERRDVIADQLQAIHRGHQVATAYGPHTSAVPGRPRNITPHVGPEVPSASNLDMTTN
ncbi:flagellar export chaperone FlgN [Botrimarina hoheduenensis]|uniref:FlgN protein n=1 Tax=Botrimarina hoheduenensis TaxID=2528000 RepID=A0A5C5VXL1_9BACT|nr:flagellar export chaperone FlgN [Botrimarina hoheduenensis]TWT43174.1 FlgN protein [Botrimarina hoheduenensis]